MCNKPFDSTRKDAKFDSAKCRVQYSRVTDNVTDNIPMPVTDKLNVTDKNTTFIPNWKRNGFKSKDHALAHALKTIEKNAKNIMKHGIDLDGVKQPITFQLKGRQFTLTEKGFKK